MAEVQLHIDRILWVRWIEGGWCFGDVGTVLMGAHSFGVASLMLGYHRLCGVILLSYRLHAAAAAC